MCRFIVVRSQEKINPKEILRAFSQMCEKSRTPDGDRQGDGWGVAWKTDNTWNLHKSIKPVWEEKAFFDTLPGTNLFAVHARSSGFPEHNNIIEFNQPYIDGSLCFVFNGMIRKVKLPFPLEGKIGAQKIFSLIKKELKQNTADVLSHVNKTISSYAQEVRGMNIALVNGQSVSALCRYTNDANYFSIHYIDSSRITVVCSEPLPLLQGWIKMNQGQIVEL